MPTVEPVVNEEKLRQLLAEQHEAPELDYKQTADLASAYGIAQFAKDVAAMQVDGGFIVVGADDRGKTTAKLTSEQAELFDEARLRAKLRRYLSEPIELRSAVHEIASCLVAVVYVGPNPGGFAIMAADGHYANDKPPVFRRGDVFVRHGTASEPWNQADIRRIISRLVEREKETWRAGLAEELQQFGIAANATQIIRGPATALTWQLDQATFDAAVIELLRANDDVPLRLTLASMRRNAQTAINDALRDEFSLPLDRLTEVAAIAIFLRRDEWLADAVAVLVDIYGRIDRLQQQTIKAEMWLTVLERVFALGGLATRLERWELVRTLVVQRPKGLHQLYRNWMRHGLTHAARANLPGPRPDGQRRYLSFIDLGQQVTRQVEALRIDGADDEEALDSLVQFDALAALSAGFGALHGDPSDPYRTYYPTFHLWYVHRVEPVLLKLVHNQDMRRVILGTDDDAALTDALLALTEPAPEIRMSAPWFGDGYEDRFLRGFIERRTGNRRG
jgi:hypothetical protein